MLAARPELLETLHPDKLLPSTDVVPERFELGTLPYELLAGTTAAVDFLAGLASPDGTGGRRDRLLAVDGRARARTRTGCGGGSRTALGRAARASPSTRGPRAARRPCC